MTDIHNPTDWSDFDFLEFEAFVSKVENEGFTYAAENYGPRFEAPELQTVADDFGTLRTLYVENEPKVDAWYATVGGERACDLHNAHVDEERQRRMADEEQQPEARARVLSLALDGLERLIATSSRDWGVYRVDAWLWAVLVGWDCEEQHKCNALCDDGGVWQELQQRHGWDDETVAKARRYRAAVRAVVESGKEA